ncbi:MAG TPA: type II secretion system protein N [Nitrospira sp.]|nr:type II secretion system protein N [Nitrospira sp.]
MSVRRTLIGLYLIGATFLVAHTINAVVAEALLVPVGVAVPRAADAVDPSTNQSAASLAYHVRTSGLFPLPPDPIATAPDGTPVAAVVQQPLNLASKMKLLGVVIGDQGGVSAIVEMIASKQQLFFRLHDQVPDVGEVAEIRRDGVLIRQGGQQEFLGLSMGEDQPPMMPRPQAASAPAVPGAPIKKTLDRREVDQAIGDLPKLLSQARAVPVMAGGAMSGFRMDYIAPSSFYEKIGLRQGDVLKQVNGVEIRDPSTMLTLFQQLRNERTVKLDVLRNNQRATLLYDIR